MFSKPGRIAALAVLAISVTACAPKHRLPPGAEVNAHGHVVEETAEGYRITDAYAGGTSMTAASLPALLLLAVIAASLQNTE